MLVKQHQPDIEELMMFYIDIRAAGKGFEEFYQRSLEMPELKYIRGRPAKVLEDKKTKDLIIHVEDGETGQIARVRAEMVVLSAGAVAAASNRELVRTLEIKADCVVLAAGMVPREESTAKLQAILKVPRGSDGFFMERHSKLGPVETTTEGVFLAGCVSGPKDISDSIAQGAAAAKAASFIAHDTVALDPTTCVVDQSLCRSCGLCVEMCDYHAPALERSADGLKAARINQALCKGCGTCAAWCPTGAITALHFTDEQINSMIDALLTG